jgi:hypothetical protein
MPTSRVYFERPAGTAYERGAGAASTDCATKPYDVGEGKTAFPILKQSCVLGILQESDPSVTTDHVLTGADGGKIIKWWIDHGDGPDQIAVAIERAWVSFKYAGAKISQLQAHDPSGPIDPAFDDPPDIVVLLGVLTKFATNPLALLAILVGFVMIGFGVYKGLQ